MPPLLYNSLIFFGFWAIVSLGVGLFCRAVVRQKRRAPTCHLDAHGRPLCQSRGQGIAFDAQHLARLAGDARPANAKEPMEEQEV